MATVVSNLANSYNPNWAPVTSCYLHWLPVTSNDILWPPGRGFLCMRFSDIVWPSVTSSDHLWPPRTPLTSCEPPVTPCDLLYDMNWPPVTFSDLWPPGPRLPPATATPEELWQPEDPEKLPLQGQRQVGKIQSLKVSSLHQFVFVGKLLNINCTFRIIRKRANI